MTWWIVGTIALIIGFYLIIHFWPGRRSDPYLNQARFRVKFANDLWSDLQRRAALGQLDYQTLLATEKQLHKIWLAQRGEIPKLTVYGEQYASAIEYLYRSTQDIRRTGGQNLSYIDSEFDHLFGHNEARVIHAREERR